LKPSIQIFAAVVLLTISASGALAHHSFSMFDQTRTDTLVGTVKSLDIVNPHSWLNVVVTSPGGASIEWALEMGGPGQLMAQGITGSSVKVGDPITARMHPLRDGSNGGQFVSAVLPGGKTLMGGPAAQGG
jgi:hypothetical protein